MADYRLCDVCDGKAFYDSNLDYEFVGQSSCGGEKITPDDCTRVVGEPPTEFFGYKLQYLGDWAVLCKNCAKTHKCVIVPLQDAQSGEEKRG
ncbi:hypothetical protein [Caballeronia sp. INML2]|uniref:hypothetical protein n=1 Tax=Caballeronia sp. INML2 TaxID=2921748 RepID=UPI00202815CB|nr:hypothetical protein [Caballeronia sp. INML2]